MAVRNIIEDRAYFTRRARKERELAATCEDRAAAMAHLKMANEYSRRAGELAVHPRMTVT
ncbi:hypothetical protein MGWOODY_Smn3480 [hydrothermal vent metagenome]|uniref:Uncharacterized protein n=1 Tax=hydrothermal vent metagenome TaxID=652676 RepID=A0A161K534_9ZZZZ